MMIKKFLILSVVMAALLCTSCGGGDAVSQTTSEKTPESSAVASYSAALGTTIMGHRVVVQVPIDDQTKSQTYLVFEKEDDTCVLYRYHFYPNDTLYQKDKSAYSQETDDTLIDADDSALMLKVKSVSPYESLEGAYAAYYNVDGFNII